MTHIELSTLKNGLRIITDTVPSVGSVALGVWVGVGTRNEDMAYNGAAHMVEHMMFKGTKTRSALDIAEQIENVGGSMNAYTSREITSYHMHLLSEDVPLALDVLADMLRNSEMPDVEIERERHVILQEIGMCHDTPDDLVFDNYFETAYPDQTLGAPILGRSDIISSMQRDTLLGYVKKHYTPATMFISAAGAIDHSSFVKMVEALFGDMSSAEASSYKEAAYLGGENRSEKELEQSHIVLGFRGISRMNKNFYPAQALANILGGGMSSRLFQEVREKRGLVYSVYAFHSAYRDDGQFAIYAGTGPDDLPELIPVICDELVKICDDVTSEELERAKTQMRAGLIMGRESMMTRADQQAKFLLFRNEKLDIDFLRGQIEALNIPAIQSVARQIFSSKPTLAALGPLKTLEQYEKISARFSERMAA
ncbi:MAG: M16 family metallopeptidase [Alphaproteobacteria bacterium]